MAIPRMEEDLEIISKLGDKPRVDDGLSTQGFKAKFDIAGVRIKNFINNTLIPAIENAVDENSLLSQISKELGQKLSLSGGTMTGTINMNGKSLYNVKTPTQDTEAAHKKYVDDAKAAAETYTDSKHLSFTATISTNWTGSSAPYKQTVSISGILATDRPHIAPVYSSTVATALEQKEAWAMVSDADTSAGSITFTCFEDKPDTAIPIQIEVNR